MNIRIERDINHTRLVNRDTGEEIKEIFAWLIVRMEEAMARDQEE